MTITSFEDKSPDIQDDVIISELASVVGDVEIGKGVCVFPGSIIRGDYSSVRIGDGTIIYESVIIYPQKEENPTLIGSHTIIRNNVVIRGAYIGDSVYISEGVTILDGATIGDGVIISPNSIISPNLVIPPRTVVAGVPATPIREVNHDEFEDIEKQAKITHDVLKRIAKFSTRF